MAAALRRIEPFAEFQSLREKLARWRASDAGFDTLFVGTSRVFHGVMPSVFDRITADAGVPTRSFNFGLDGMFSPEDAFVVEEILRRPPRQLRWIIIEAGAFRAEFEDRPAKSVRSVYWHDWPRTWLCMRERLWLKGKRVKWGKYFESDKGKPTPASEALLHLEVFVMRTLNIGRGSDAWKRIAIRVAVERTGLDPQGDGFLPMPARFVMSAPERARFEQEVAERRQAPAVIEPLRPHPQESFDRMCALAAKRGAQVILLLAPTTAESTRRPDPRTGVETFDFRDVEKYPELFVADVRSDRTHLNAKGAELFSRRLAERFVEYRRTQSDPER
jgi:hypothetical protein